MTISKEIVCNTIRPIPLSPMVGSDKNNGFNSELSPHQDKALSKKAYAGRGESAFYRYRSQDIFRPSFEEHYQSFPPLCRDMSLILPSSVSSESEDEQENVPTDFVPPMRTFPKSNGLARKPRQQARFTRTSKEAVGLQFQDVICGYFGSFVISHPGNQLYRQLIKEYLSSKIRAYSKAQIAMEVQEILKSRGVRFVKRAKNKANNIIWVEISENRAYEQIFRDAYLANPPQFRRRRLVKSKRKDYDATDIAASRKTQMVFEDQSIFAQRRKHSSTSLPLFPLL